MQPSRRHDRLTAVHFRRIFDEQVVHSIHRRTAFGDVVPSPGPAQDLSGLRTLLASLAGDWIVRPVGRAAGYLDRYHAFRIHTRWQTLSLRCALAERDRSPAARRSGAAPWWSGAWSPIRFSGLT